MCIDCIFGVFYDANCVSRMPSVTCRETYPDQTRPVNRNSGMGRLQIVLTYERTKERLYSWQSATAGLTAVSHRGEKRPYWPRIVAIVVNAADRSIQTLAIHFHSDYERQTIYKLSTTNANYTNLKTTPPNPHTTRQQHRATATVFTSEKTGGSPGCDWRQHATGTCLSEPIAKPIGCPWRHVTS